MRTVSAAHRQPGYAVAWRNTDGAVATGGLALERTTLVLHGTDEAGAVTSECVPFGRVTAVRIGRAASERVRGGRSILLELRCGGTLCIAPIGAAGAVFELADLVAHNAATQRPEVA